MPSRDAPRRRSLIAAAALAMSAQFATASLLLDDATDQRAYLTANGLLNRGLYDLAAAEYRAFLDQNPNHEKVPLARYGLGVALFRGGDRAGALEQLQQAPADPSFEFAAETALLTGHCHLTLGDPGQAAQAFERVLERHGEHPSAPDAAALLVEAQQRAGRHEEAIAAADELVRRWPDAPMRARAELFKGLAQLARNKPADAAPTFRSIIERTPDADVTPNARLLYAQSLHRDGQLDAAAAAYRETVSRAPGALAQEAGIGLAQLLRQQRRFDDAGALLDGLLGQLKDSPLEARAKLERARVWYDRGEHEMALPILSDLAASAPEDLRDDADYWIAKCAMRAGADSEAASRLAEAQARYPKSELLPEIIYDRAVALSRADRSDEAAQAIGAFLEQYPKHRLMPDALHAAASIEYARARYEQALALCALYEASFKAHAMADEVLMLRAESRYMRSELQEAERAYRELLEREIAPGLRTRATYRLGLALARDGRFDEAEPLLTGVVGDSGADPAFARALLALGDGTFEAQRWADAERYFARVVALGAPSTPLDDALLKQGLAMQRQGAHERALPVFQRLLTEFPDSDRLTHARFELGQALVALERWEEARPWLSAVLEADDRERFEAHAMSHLGAIARARGDHAAAAEWFAKAAEVGGADLAARALYDQGEALLVAGQSEGAIEKFQAFLTKHPEHPMNARAMARLSVALSRAGEHERALEQLEAIPASAFGSLAPEIRHSAMYERAWSMRELDRPDEAAAAYRELLDEPVDEGLRVYALLDLGGIELDAQRWEPASEALSELVGMLESASDRAPQDVRAQAVYRLGAASLKLGRHERTVELLDTFHERHPESELRPSAGLMAAESLAALGRHERAAEHLDRVASEHADDPSAPTALLRLGDATATLQRWDDSQRAYERFLEAHAEDELWFQARFGVAWAKENRGEHEAAIRDYREVVSRHQGPTAARAQFQIGECLFAMGRLEEAVTELLRVDILYAYDEWSAAALYEAGRVLERLERPHQARAQYEAVVQRFPDLNWAEMARQRLDQVQTQLPPGARAP
jgi:TolA-binding protein